MNDLDLMVCAHMCDLDRIANQMIEYTRMGIMDVHIEFPFAPTEADYNYLRNRLNKEGIDI